MTLKRETIASRDGVALRIDRGAIIEAARHVLALHPWMVGSDFDQEGAVERAERHLA